MRVFNSPTVSDLFLEVEQDPQRSRGARAREGVLVLIALLGALGSFGGQRDHWWYPYVSGTFCVVGATVLTHGFAWPRLVVWSRSLARRRRLGRAARELSASFHGLANQLGLLVDADNTNSFVRYAWDLTARDPAWRAKLPAVIPPWYFADFFSMFRRRLAAWNGSYDELRALGRDFTAVVIQFDQVFVRPTLDTLRRLDPTQLPDDVRRKVNLLREDYGAFVRQYRTFVQVANSRLEGQVFPAYLEVPEAF